VPIKNLKTILEEENLGYTVLGTLPARKTALVVARMYRKGGYKTKVILKNEDYWILGKKSRG